VRADDKLFDALGAGQVYDGDPVTTKLAEWRADITEDEPSTAGDLARIVADRLTGNELLTGAWVILDAFPVGAVIVLRVVTWAPSTGVSSRTETRYVLRLDPEHAPAP